MILDVLVSQLASMFDLMLNSTFFPYRRPPIHLRIKIESELDRQRNEVFWYLLIQLYVSFRLSAYSSHLAGTLEFAGTTSFSIVTRHSMSTQLRFPGDLFSVLIGGKYFTKLDLTDAYNQLKVDEDSQRYLAINTHKGLLGIVDFPLGLALHQRCSKQLRIEC